MGRVSGKKSKNSKKCELLTSPVVGGHGFRGNRKYWQPGLIDLNAMVAAAASLGQELVDMKTILSY